MPKRPLDAYFRLTTPLAKYMDWHRHPNTNNLDSAGVLLALP